MVTDFCVNSCLSWIHEVLGIPINNALLQSFWCPYLVIKDGNFQFTELHRDALGFIGLDNFLQPFFALLLGLNKACLHWKNIIILLVEVINAHNFIHGLWRNFQKLRQTAHFISARVELSIDVGDGCFILLVEVKPYSKYSWTRMICIVGDIEMI